MLQCGSAAQHPMQPTARLRSCVPRLRPISRPLTGDTADEDEDDDNTIHAEPLATAALPRQVRGLHVRRLRSIYPLRTATTTAVGRPGRS